MPYKEKETELLEVAQSIESCHQAKEKSAH